MKKFLFLSLSLILLFFLTGCNNNSIENEENKQIYNISRVSTENNSSSNINNINSSTPVNSETELSSFSTKIYTPNDEARQNNIRITCSTLDGTIVKSRRNIFFL